MKCKVCDKRIRGNAGSESYDETTGTMSFICRSCTKQYEQDAKTLELAGRIRAKLTARLA